MIKITLNFSLILLLFLAACTSSSNHEAESRDDTSAAKTKTQAGPMKTILFFGNSLTAGYGLEPEEAFPALIQDKIDSLNLPYKVINAGLSGETSAGGKSRIEWLLKQPVDVFVLELGANDGLRGIPVDETTANLQSIVDQVKAKYPNVKLVMTGMQVPPNMGNVYATQFSQIFKKIADKNKMAYVPFLLDRVGGVAELNQSDGIHPTAEGQVILAENVWAVLEDILLAEQF
ncbi:MAG TPA: arylesterase [Daejeonella sp.]|nr:arylesterase [Daejeonella sp.]